jgi:hypothetical protein
MRVNSSKLRVNSAIQRVVGRVLGNKQLVARLQSDLSPKPDGGRNWLMNRSSLSGSVSLNMTVLRIATIEQWSVLTC